MAKPEIERRGIAAQLADRLEEAIRAGEWKGKIPGRRTLATQYRVNAKTSEAALDILEQRGLLDPAEKGKRRRIKEDFVLTKPKAKKKARLLILHNSSIVLSSSDLLIIRALQNEWEKRMGDVVLNGVDFNRYHQPKTLLKEMVERYRADALLLSLANKSWSEASQECLPSFQLGGEYVMTENLSLTGYTNEAEVGRVLEYLRKLGHERILMPCDNRGELQYRSLVAGWMQGMGVTGNMEQWKKFCPLFQENVPEVWRSYWKKAFTEVQPTAVVVAEASYLISLYGFCYAHGIRIPQDLSVICMDYEDSLDWAQPRPVMMKFPLRKAEAHFKAWMVGGLRGTGKRMHPLEMLPGESVAKVRGA